MVLRAECAKLGALCFHGFRNGSSDQGFAVAHGLTVLIVVIFFAEAGPVDHAVRNGSRIVFRFRKLLRGDGIVIDGGSDSRYKRNSGNDGSDLLRLGIEILVLEQEDQNGKERDNACDHAKIVPEEELDLVLFRSGVDVIRLFPKLRCNDDRNEVKTQRNEQEKKFVVANIDRAVQNEERSDFEQNADDPQNNGSNAAADSPSFWRRALRSMLCFLYFALFAGGDRFFRLLLCFAGRDNLTLYRLFFLRCHTQIPPDALLFFPC